MAAAATSTNRRKCKRIRWRLQVVFDNDPTRRAFTNDLSQSGLRVASDFVSLPGTEVRGAIVLPDGARTPFAALVRWARKVRGADALHGTNAMGLEFAAPIGAEYLAFLEGAPRGSDGAPDPRVSGVLRRTPTPLASEAQQPEARDRFSAVTWPASPVNQTCRLPAVAEARDLALPSRLAGAGIDSSRAAEWFAEATRRCIAALLPPGTDSVVVGLSVSVAHHPALEPGTKLVTFVKATRLTARGRTVAFEATLSAGEQQLAAGTVARLLVDKG